MKKPKTVIDDLSIPEETIIYYDKGNKYIENLILLIALAIGVYFSLLPNKDDERITGLILAGVATVLLYLNGKLKENREPQIVINNKGIQTSTNDFKSWKDISNDKVEIGYRTGDFLIYDYPKGDERFFIGNLDTDRKKLEILLRIYRYRYDNNKSKS